MTTRNDNSKPELCYETRACEILGITPHAFKKLNLKPKKVVPNPHYKKRESRLYDKDFILSLCDTATIQALRPKTTRKTDYSDKFEKKYAENNPLPDVMHAMSCMNYYSKQQSCSQKNKREIISLKAELIKQLFNYGYCSSRLIAIENIPAEKCSFCSGTGKYKNNNHLGKCGCCDGTGVYKEKTNHYHNIFVFDFGGNKYIWRLPSERVCIPVEADVQYIDFIEVAPKPIEVQTRQLTEMKKLIEWYLLKEACIRPMKNLN